MLTVAMVAGGALLVAGPAAAEHVDGYYCGDTPTADVGDGEMTNDTPTACIVESRGGGTEGGDGAGGVGAVPTRIDTGAGGAATGGTMMTPGAGLTGVTAAAGAAVAARRRRRP